MLKTNYISTALQFLILFLKVVLISNSETTVGITRIKQISTALTSVARLVEGHPMNQKVVGSIPDQGTSLGYRLSPPSGRILEATDISISLSPHLSF